MSDTKWADVAHYYLKSGIYITWKTIFDNSELVAPIGTMSLDSLTTMPDVKPILRHRDDMTEAEAREIYRLVWGFDIEISVSMWDSGLDWFESLHGMYHPAVFLWLISRGFDVFGLIESGQAIRKEVGNG